MAFTEREKARIVGKCIQTGSVTATKHWVQMRMQRTPPSRNTIIHWHNLFMENGTPVHRGGNGRQRASELTVEQVRLMFENQSRLRVRAAASTLQVSNTIVHCILRKFLFCNHAKYKISILFAAATKLSD